LIKPVFYWDELVFFTCMGTHVADNGGAQAGSHFLRHALPLALASAGR
jgi:N-methylhydantoinase B